MFGVVTGVAAGFMNSFDEDDCAGVTDGCWNDDGCFGAGDVDEEDEEEEEADEASSAAFSSSISSSSESS